MTEIAEIVPVLAELLKPFNLENKPLVESTDIPAELNIDSVGVLISLWKWKTILILRFR